VPGPAPQLIEALHDRYTIERELGHGGMATVYLAHDRKHDRLVALKLLHAELAHTLGPDRFQREIRLAAGLQHPHILTVLDSGEAAGLLWYTMPYVEGESLRDRLRRERQLPLDEALRIATEAARALDYAHRHGVIHRDIKPENILLTRDGDTLVADFGVGRALGGSTREPLTGTGLVVGTPHYMSPEQAVGQRELDGRTDLYSLACVLYEMLAGEAPFGGPTAQLVLARRLTETPRPLTQVRETVPEPVSQAVQRALARVPADRFPSTAEFARALAVTQAAIPPGVRTPRRRVPWGVVVLAIAILLGLALLSLLFRGRSGAESATATRLAVLPFENLGDSADAYFADGVADAIRGKLTALPGLEVIASSSSNQYRRTTKRPQQIGRELEARYLLVGRVRWARAEDGTSRVQVRPELVDASSGAERWGEAFEAPLTDVFAVEAEIAGKVAEALDVALGTREHEVLGERPTSSLEAYDALLRGDEISRGASTNAPAALQAALPYYRRAVALDSGFALAWTRLARVHALLYNPNFYLPADSAAAARAGARALALAPSLPDSRLALGEYYRRVEGNQEVALEQYEIGRRLAPSDGRFLAPMSLADQSLGRWEDAVAHAREGFRLDPRSSTPARYLSRALVFLRRYDEALAAADQAVTLDPTSPDAAWAKAVVHVARGDLAAAQAVYREVSPPIPRPTLVAFMSLFWELVWTLEPADLDLLVSLSPSEFGDDRAGWGLCLAMGWALKGDTARSRALADSARIGFEQLLRANPRNDQAYGLMGLGLAYAGRYDEAVAAARRSVALLGPEADQYNGIYNQLQLARVYAIAGRLEEAEVELERLLRVPSYLSPGWLRIDPTFAALRGRPRFDRLVGQRP
jgi:serine/threonine protein kinase/tetratricopeptide (TPR) repeat protein